MKYRKTPKMLVVRWFRESTIVFYNQFKKFRIDYVIAPINKKTDISLNNISENLKLSVLDLYRPLGIDPVETLGFGTNNLSWKYIKGIEEYVKNCDVVNISDTYYFFNRQIVELARKYKKPVVTVIWTTIPGHISTWLPPYSWNVNRVVSSTDLFILRCKSAYKFTDSLNIPREKTEVIYKGVDLNRFYPSKKQDGGKVNILYAGNLHKSKGIIELIEAVEKLYHDGLNITLTISGKGNLEEYILEKSKYLPIKALGFVNYAKLADVYRSADIFCSPSGYANLLGIRVWEEYFSYTLMEAQASGLPIVSSQSGGIGEEVDSRNPLIKVDDGKGLYLALKSLVEDKFKRNYLGKINRERAEKLFDAKIQAQKTENRILALLKSREDNY